ncbi:hypothetical protein P3H15_52130 [Rhodococcus sp. T2V]|uniref:hypothetical protein n=1 Tax=Rhodococcus sp. T2V TaxID=3034164 RepID=UPI0023E18CE0|nr:hypothetical protein [Rhodococcus sp. T2V]MDF3313455.1 hypothetical protein [Rhodococcus sp. T2V]
MTDQDLNQQVDEIRTKLGALRRLVIAVTESAGEHEAHGIVDDLSDVTRYLNDAGNVLADVIVEGSTDSPRLPD